MKKIARISPVLDATGLSKASLYRRVADGTFPAPVRIGPNSTGWICDEIDAWIASRPRAGGQASDDGSAAAL